MDKNEAKLLLEKYQNGTASADEKGAVDVWYNQLSAEALLDPVAEDLKAEKILIWSRLPEHAIVKPVKTIPIRKLGRILQITAVAAALALFAIGIYFFITQRHSEHDLSAQSANDIAPGKAGATLTLANGKKISLTSASKGKLASESGILITKTTDGQVVYEISSLADNDNDPSWRVAKGDKATSYNTLSTANGETYSIKLSDGTLVTLNAGSTLRFPSSFTNLSDRRTELSGEGYFKVRHSPKQPFFVTSRGQVVQDLGTEFNISSYPDETRQKTTLIEGSAKVTSLQAAINSSLRGGTVARNEAKQTITLKPGQQTILTNENLTVVPADISETVAWKNNLFKFNEERLEDILTKVARWYNVSFTFDNSALKDQQFSGSISKLSTVSKVLEKLEIAGSVHFERKERRIIVKN